MRTLCLILCVCALGTAQTRSVTDGVYSATVYPGRLAIDQAFIDLSENLNDACANCHKVYRDKGGTEGSGTTRCPPTAEEK